jgi:hypothetical protein
MQYQFNSGMGGSMVEIYLPKKARYQTVLYSTLTDGFDREKVIGYLRAHKPSIQRTIAEELYDKFDMLLDGFQHVFHGYSIYEVDGAFRQQGEHSQSDEDRTLVIRLILVPDYDSLLENLPGAHAQRMQQLAKEFLRSPRYTDDFIAALAGEGRLAPEERAFVEMLGTWIDHTSLFIYGYVIHRICSQIEGFEEEEIWVTSFSDTVVNAVTRVARP